jgi:hypothetical protein
MSEPSAAFIASRVREYLRDSKPGGVTLDVDESHIHRIDSWWRVPIRPSRWPERMFEFYEVLAEIESEIQEREHLDVIFSTGEPIEEDAAR